MRFYIVLFALSWSFFSRADVDEFNTYRWNRKNVLQNSGRIDKSPWFEWWYYKLVLPKTNKSFFFVYGVVNPWDNSKSLVGTRSYVGMGDFAKKIQVESLFDVSDFFASYTEPLVTVGNNIATEEKVKGLVFDEDGREYSWDFTMDKKWTFNPEGPLIGKMFTNIEWYSAQADAHCTGQIVSDREVHEFTDVPCYQDRNWGKSFPNWWAWIVSNHFENSPGTALSIGGGHPKIFGLNSPYQGVSVGLRYKGKDYIFSPFNFDRVKVSINFGKWEVTGINGKYKIKVIASAPKESFMDLQFMTPDGEIFHDYETLTGLVTVKLYKRGHIFSSKWKLVETLTSKFAGIEYGSRNTYSLLDNLYNARKVLFTTEQSGELTNLSL